MRMIRSLVAPELEQEACQAHYALGSSPTAPCWPLGRSDHAPWNVTSRSMEHRHAGGPQSAPACRGVTAAWVAPGDRSVAGVAEQCTHSGPTRPHISSGKRLEMPSTNGSAISAFTALRSASSSTSKLPMVVWTTKVHWSDIVRTRKENSRTAI